MSRNNCRGGKKYTSSIEDILNKKPKRNRVLELLERVEADKKRKKEQSLTEKESAYAAKLEHSTNEIIEQARNGKIVNKKPSLKQLSIIKTDKKTLPKINKNRPVPGDFIRKDSRVSSLVNCGDIIESFLKMCKSAKDNFTYVNEKYTEADRLRVDLEHNIELEWGNCYQTFLIGRQMKEALMQRRDYKDLHNMMVPIACFVDNNPEVLEALSKILAAIRKAENLRENRIYVPRTDANLPVADNFNNLPADQQYELKQLYKKKRGIS